MEGTITSTRPVGSMAERAAAEGRVGSLLDDMHREGVEAMKVADRLGDVELHQAIGLATVAVDDARQRLAGSES
jgi:hypothetical protein